MGGGSRLWLLLFLPLLLRALRVRPLPSREKVLRPRDERVVLLGASSGIGRDLALRYAAKGARICIVARRKDALEKVNQECLALGLSPERVLVVVADTTKVEDLVKVRKAITEAWGGLDTLHILVGVPFTHTLLETAGVSFSSLPNSPKSSLTKRKLQQFHIDGKRLDSQSVTAAPMPSEEGLRKVAAETRACSEINFVSTTLAVACFLPLLAASSPSPAIHHLSSVAALYPASVRSVYSATKGAALHLVESVRMECEGCGVRFLSVCPGTIDNDFRNKTATAGAGGRNEVEAKHSSGLEKYLLPPKRVVDTILHHLSLNPSPQPLIPFVPLSALSSLLVPPPSVVVMPAIYQAARLMTISHLLSYWIYEPTGRAKYGLARWPG